MTHSGAGDLLRVFNALDPRDHRTRAAIARLLDVDWSAEPFDEPTVPPPEAERGAATRDHVAVDATVSGPAGPTTSSIPGPEYTIHEQAAAAVIRRVRGPVSAPPAWLRSAAQFTESALGLPAPQPAAPLPDLFVPDWTRAILSALLATARRDGEVDLPVLIDRVVKGEALTGVPRRARPTLASGVQILVDRSEVMSPFHGDVSRLVRQIASLTGADGVDEVLFDGCPTRGAARPGEEDWRQYSQHGAAIGDDDRPLIPPPGTRILCLTDLGIGQPAGAAAPASPTEWLQFAEHARQARCPVVCLVPYDPIRWPPALARRLTIVQWDRASTPASIARAVRRRAWRRERA